MSKLISTAAGWVILLVASVTLAAACYSNMHSYAFNQFMLLLLIVPAAMLLMLGRIFRR